MPPPTSPDLEPVPALVLAGGSSSRLGQPKQLLVFEQETLLHRAVRTALAAGCRPVLVVTGALHAELGAALGRDGLVHVAVAPGPLVERLLCYIRRLAGFRANVLAPSARDETVYPTEPQNTTGRS